MSPLIIEPKFKDWFAEHSMETQHLLWAIFLILTEYSVACICHDWCSPSIVWLGVNGIHKAALVCDMRVHAQQQQQANRRQNALQSWGEPLYRCVMIICDIVFWSIDLSISVALKAGKY